MTEDAENRQPSVILLGSPAGVGKTAMMKQLMEGLLKQNPDGSKVPPKVSIISVTTSEDYKEAMKLSPALADRLTRMPIIQFAPLPPETMVKVALKMLAKSPLTPEEQQALAEFIVDQYCAGGEIPAQGLRGMSKLVDETMAAPLSPEAQAAVIKKLLAASPLEQDQQVALADIIIRQVDGKTHKVGNGGCGLKTAVDKTLEGPLSPDMEAVMIEKSPAYAAGVSRRNGGKLADAFTQGGGPVKPMKRIQLKSNPGATL